MSPNGNPVSVSPVTLVIFVIETLIGKTDSPNILPKEQEKRDRGTEDRARKGRRDDRTHHQRTGTLGIDRLAPTQRTTPIGPTVISTLEANDVLFTSGFPSDLDGSFHRFGPRVPEEETVQRGVGHGRQEFFDQLEVRCVEAY